MGDADEGEISLYASPFEKGGLRGIYLRWRGLKTNANPPFPPFTKGGVGLQEDLKIIKKFRTPSNIKKIATQMKKNTQPCVA